MPDGSTRDATRFSLRAVLAAVGVVCCGLIAISLFGLAGAALVVVMVIVARNVATQSTDRRSTTHREWTAFSRILLGIVSGGLTGVGCTLLHALLHFPGPVAGQPLANEWWTVGVIVCALVSASFGLLIGILLAAVPRRVRCRSTLSAFGGAGIGLLVSHYGQTPEPGLNMFLGCLYSALSAGIAVALVVWAGRAEAKAQ